MTTVGTANDVPFVAVPGGVLMRDADGDVVGAIGVSGASADEDEHCGVGARTLARTLGHPSPLALLPRALAAHTRSSAWADLSRWHRVAQSVGRPSV